MKGNTERLRITPITFAACHSSHAAHNRHQIQTLRNNAHMYRQVYLEMVYFLTYCRWISTRRLGMHGRRYRCQAADCQGYPRMTRVRVMVRLCNPGLEREKTIRYIEFLT